jgi:hypothetical protein
LEDAVSELEEAWALALAEAERLARAAGRTDISEYLALRNSNDLIRKTASDWLLGMFAAAAGAANRAGAAIQISTHEGHRFKVGNASMVGTRLSLGSGVRLLAIETGWPRTPRDGFIRGGGLACANIKHQGIRSANEELRLVLGDSGIPTWMVEVRNAGKHLARHTDELHEFHETNVKKHLALLLTH